MTVNDDIKTSSQCLVNSTGNLVEEVGLDGAIGLHVYIPCNRNANGLGTCGSNVVKQLGTDGLYTIPIAPAF